jgi:hypothetical protein
MSPTSMPIRNAIRRLSGITASRCVTPFWIATAHSTASTGLANLTSAPSPISLTTLP